MIGVGLKYKITKDFFKKPCFLTMFQIGYIQPDDSTLRLIEIENI